MKKTTALFTISLPLLLFFASCKKYLGAKPDKQLATPTAIQDLQGLLDYYSYMNAQCSDASEIASDNYYLTDESFLGLADDGNRYAYLWQPGLFAGASPDDWQNEYTIVYNSNIVLENINNIERTGLNASAWDNCKGEALVFRGKSFYEIAQIWSKAWDSTTSKTDLGIPLRLASDFNIKSVRSTVEATYNQIIGDLKMAVPLLPDKPIFPYRPSKPAAYGLLARAFLTMGDYVSAGKYADSALQLQNGLVDFNSLDSTADNPFSAIQFTNPEDIMHSACSGANSRDLRYNRAKTDTSLAGLYDRNDLRKVIFFGINGDQSLYFKGSYDGSYNYNGIATDEMYLTRAECNARQGQTIMAMHDLNSLLASRWKKGTFIPFSATSPSDALSLVLKERRKELVYRMLRFTDVKRLNKQGAGILLKRVVQGQTYTLPPNDPRYALPIPDDVIQLAGLEQN